MTEIIHYSLERIIQTKFENNYEITSDIKKILDMLETQIIVPTETYEPTSSNLRRNDKSFDRNQRGNSHMRGSRRGGSNSNSRNSSSENLNTIMDDWNAVRNFKATDIVKAVGFEKELNEIRCLLNKLSPKNYETQKDEILVKVKEVVGVEDDNINDKDSNKIKVANMIFDIASANRFMSEVYADMYVELVGEYETFGEILDGLLIKYRETINHISYVDPNENYDKFCDYNKENELRKANTCFIMNLTKRDMISRKDVMDVIIELQELTLKFINEDNRKNEVDEISENMLLFITMGNNFLSSELKWSEQIIPFLEAFSKKKAKEYKSLTSRSVFKYMDMIGK
tara:strand:- start:141 stop:1166 length:1026 start_codon:yes stop_codon:yes gene_type:complete